MSLATKSPTVETSRPAAGPALLLFALAVLAVFAFLPSLWGEFVSDDQMLIVDNPLLDSWQGLWKIWSSAEPLDPWPLTNGSFWIWKQAFGKTPFAFHALNLALHALNACLLFLLLRSLALPGAWLAAALWALHPVQAETVAWASELKNLLCMSFALLATRAYWRFDRDGRSIDYALALASFGLALLAKSAAAPLPAVWLLLLWWKRGSLGPSDFLRSLPFFVLATLAAVAAIWFQAHRAGAAWSALDWSMPQRALNSLAALGSYAQTTLIPWACRFDVPHPTELADARRIAGALFVIAGVLFWIRRNRWGRGPFAALAACVLLLSPLLGFFDHYMLRFSPAADRWQYFASAAAIVGLVWAGGKCFAPFPKTGKIAICAFLILVLGALSFERSKVFQAEETLWEDTLSRNPRSALARAGLGRVAALRMDLSRAESLLREAIEIDPRFLLARDYLGWTLRAKRDDAAAESVWRETIVIEPRFALGRESLGLFLIERGRHSEAMAMLREALRIDPYLYRARAALNASSQ